MSRLSKFVDKKLDLSPTAEPNPTHSPTRTVEDLRKDPNYIRVFDGFGREMFVTKERWRTGSLPGALKANWDHPDNLYNILAMAMRDGFFADILDAADHLFHIDPNPSRGSTVYGIVLMKVGKLDQAEEVLCSYLKTHGDDGVILTNLAKVQAARNEMQTAEKTLWRALIADPNTDNAFAWHLAIHRERDGEAAVVRELERIAALPGSWRAQLWLARTALDSRDFEKALALYREGLSHAVRPPPTDMLMQMSGDLGNRGLLAEALRLVEPEFVPRHHGLLVGNNFIKANLDLGKTNDAAKILEQLYSLQRPDWKEQLSFWDTALAKAKIAGANTNLRTPLAATMLTIEGPVWLKPSSPANTLFARESMQEVFVCFLGGSATVSRESEQIQVQRADTPGRLSRALPLLLAEQVHFHSGAIVQTLIPWIQSDRGGFILSGAMWNDADAARYAKMVQPKSQFVVVTHLSTDGSVSSVSWNIQLRLIEMTEAQCVATIEDAFSLTRPEEILVALSRRLMNLLAKQTKTECCKPPTYYQVPGGAQFADYLLRIEQLLVLSATQMVIYSTPPERV